MPRNKTTKRVEESRNPFERYRSNFKVKNKPEQKEPNMPTSVSAQSSDKLGDLMTRYSAWREYAEDCVQDAFVEFMRIKRNHDYEWELLFIQTNGKTIKDREMVVNCNTRIKKLSDQLDDADLYHTLLTNKLESFSNCLTIISREVSRRSNH